MKKKSKPTPTKKPNGVGTILWFLAILAAAIGVFWLPWFIPFSTPVVGESYALGFNNKVGVLALGFSLFLGAAACWFGSRPPAYKWLQPNPRYFPPWREATAEYVVLICYSALMAGFLFFWSNYLVDPAWCEARSFIYEMDLLTLGQVPYRDFMCNYGPATIYLPLWLSYASHGLLSTEQAYSIILVLFTIGGAVALFVFLRSLELPKSARPLILGLGLLIWTSTSTGVQYAPLRFFIVPLSLVFLDAIATRESTGRIPPAVRIGLTAAIAVGACLALSPEMGIAATVAVASYGFILFLRRSIASAVACLLAAVVVFVAMLVAFPGYLDAVFAFGGGGGNFPIYPNLNNLCMVAAALILLPPLIVSALTNPTEKKAPLAICLAVGGGMLLPAGFGRCDPGHVASNGEILLFLMFAATAAMGGMAFRIWTVVYAAIWVGVLEYSYWTLYIPNYTFAINMHEYYQTHPDQVEAWKEKWNALRLASPHGRDLHWSKTLMFPDGLDQLTSKGRVILTSGNEGNLWLARYLLLQKDPPREYFHAYSQGVSTAAQIERKVEQDRAYQFLIMPESDVAMVGRKIDLAAYSQGTDSFLSRLLFFPVTSEAKNMPYLPDTEYAAQMLNYYKILGRFNDYLVLERKDSGDAGASP